MERMIRSIADSIDGIAVVLLVIMVAILVMILLEILRK